MTTAFDDYNHARRDAALFDQSSCGKVEVTATLAH